MSVDASSWGMGEVMWNQSWHPVEYFHTAITADDVDILRVTIGESGSMPVLEALAVGKQVRIGVLS